MKLTRQKLEGWGYRMEKNFMILFSTVFVRIACMTDGRTRDSI